MPRCSVIIPVYNKASLTRQCLDALLAHPPQSASVEIVVVDDASTDSTARLLVGYGDRVCVVTHAANAGFATSCNDGAAVAAGEYLIFLNNDTIPKAGWLDALLRYVDGHPRAAVVGARLLFPDDTVQHAGVVICQDREPRHLYAGFPADHPAVNKSRRFQIVTGACLLIRRDLFLREGGFDPAFLNGYEDVDLCLRLGQLGHEIHYCHECVLYHLESVSVTSREGQPAADLYNLRLYLDRWSDRVRPDDFHYYLEDGLIRADYRGDLYPVRLTLSPLAAVVDGGHERRADRLLFSRAREALDLLKNNIHLNLRAREAELRSSFHTGNGASHPVAHRPPTPTAEPRLLARGRVQQLSEGPGGRLLSVILPVKNAGRKLRELLPRVLSQRTGDSVEIVAVDSGSADDTVDVLTRFGATVVSIDPRTFNHGRTRNLAARFARGDYLIFLTQSALPADDRWLANLVAPLDQDPSLAAVCGRVLPREDADVLTHKDVVRNINASAERSVRAITDLASYRALPHHELRLVVNFHTMSAAIRADVFRRLPFHEADFGEDLIWGKEALEAGLKIQFEPTSVVLHSHNYSFLDILRRNFDDGLINRAVVGRNFDEGQVLRDIANNVRDDWGYLEEVCGLGAEEVEHWRFLSVLRRTAQVVGQWLGVNCGPGAGDLTSLLSITARIKAGATTEAADGWDVCLETSLGGAGPRGAGFSAPAEAPVVAPPPTCLATLGRSKLCCFLAAAEKLAFPVVENPVVTVVIPTFNKACYTYLTLEALLASEPGFPFELVVIDNASADETPALLGRLENVRVRVNEHNLGFGAACNLGAEMARGEFVCFLNSDTLPNPGWLGALVRTIRAYPRCGAVGGKLVHPDGKLQETGSIIWRDGSTSGYGRGEDPLRPEYCYVREVDYCSAACLLVRKDLFLSVGGFDDRYAPAYYEDADLCLSIREAGYKVVCQPKAVVFHVEFGSSEGDRGVALQLRNRSRFTAKWDRRLLEQSLSHPGNVIAARERRRGRRILVVDDLVPVPGQGRGLPRARAMLNALVELGYVVTFLPYVDESDEWALASAVTGPAIAELQQSGIEVLHGPPGWRSKLEERPSLYDAVIVSRPDKKDAMEVVRRVNPAAPLIYDAEAIFALRTIGQAEAEGMPLPAQEADSMVRSELALTDLADVVMTVSGAERSHFLDYNPHLPVVVWGHPVAAREVRANFGERQDLLFVGNLGTPPNAGAVLHLLREIVPELRTRLGCRLLLVGPDATAEVVEAASALPGAVVLAGYVEDVAPVYDSCRVFVAPHLFAAGIPLKVIEAMSNGVPCVISRLLADQLEVGDEDVALVAEGAKDFTEKVTRLYHDQELWQRVQQAARRWVETCFDPAAMRATLGQCIEEAIARKKADRTAPLWGSVSVSAAAETRAAGLRS
jgi:GT2 family glycosyltransferase/glycosyltransferase involved in cell wall biosynthesis